MDRDLQIGEEVVTGDHLAVGDLVYFDTTLGHQIIIRKLSARQARSFQGKIYRVEPGSTPESVHFRLITADENEEADP